MSQPLTRSGQSSQTIDGISQPADRLSKGAEQPKLPFEKFAKSLQLKRRRTTPAVTLTKESPTAANALPPISKPCAYCS